MSRRKYKAQAKSSVKMTRDGLVERNAATGEEKRVSKRETDLDLRGDPSEQGSHSRIENKAAKSQKKAAYGQMEAEPSAPQAKAQNSDSPPILRQELESAAAQSDTEQTSDTPRPFAKAPSGKAKTRRNTAYRQNEPTALQHEPLKAAPSQENTAAQEYNTKPPKSRAAEADTPLTDASAKSGEKPDSMVKTNKSGKLQFTQDEAASQTPENRKLEKAERQAERVGGKLEKARNKLPAKRKLRSQRVFDEEKGKAKRKLYFEKEVKTQSQHPKGALPLRPAKAGANAAIGYAHKKIHQVEHENVGTQAAHKVEMLAEGGVRSVLRFHRIAPYRKVAKLERKAAKKSIKLSYQQALADNPKLKSNLVSRLWQKRKIKKQYAKAAREAQKAAKRAQKAGSITARAVRAVAGIVRRHPIATAVIVLLAMLLFIFMSLFGLASSVGTGGLGGILNASYLAEDADIDNAELFYTEWETDLQIQIANVESDRPGYDEYRYNIGDISHNPYELMAYLTVVYQNFPYDAISGELRALFDEQYTLTFTEATEIRYRTETRTGHYTDSEGNRHSYTYTVEVPYEWYVLNITLIARSFSDVVYPRMDADQLQHYSLLMETKGSKQYIDSPFDFNWLSYVTSYYGWRIHPTTGAKNYHKGVDIGVPTGTEIHAGLTGTVTYAGFSGDYGNVVVIEDGKGLVAKYAHCGSLLVSAGQSVAMGDVIATVGSTGNSTGPHLHLEIIKDGQYLNALYFCVTNDDGSELVYGNPGAAMGDGSYAAMIAEAEKYLGYPYVWGGSSPSTSFDCSGYVSWVINQSGVGSVGRQTAQGLYNLCTPVSASEAQPGDLIFFVGTYSTTGVSHVGIYVGNGQMIHCGNPISYANINTSYWQSHFFSFGRLP